MIISIITPTAFTLLLIFAVTLTFTYHGLNGEHMARLHNSDGFVFWERNEHRDHRHVGGQHIRTFRDLRRVRGAVWLLTGIMWHIGSGVEESVDAVATVAPHHREAVGLSVLLDDVT